MKAIFLGFAVLCASVNAAIPDDSKGGRSVTGAIHGAMDDFKANIREQGYDPYILNYSVEHRLPVSELLVMKADIEQLLVVGLSDIIVDDLNYVLVTSRVHYRLVMPRVSLKIDATIYTKTFGVETNTQLKGSVHMVNCAVTGAIRITQSLFGNHSVRWISAIFWMGYVESDLTATIFGVDYSEKFNNFFQSTFPDLLRADEYNVNAFFEHLMWKAVPQWWT